MERLVKWSADNIPSLRSRSENEIEALANRAWQEIRRNVFISQIVVLLLVISLAGRIATQFFGTDYSFGQYVFSALLFAAILGAFEGFIIQTLLRKRMRQLAGDT